VVFVSESASGGFVKQRWRWRQQLQRPLEVECCFFERVESPTRAKIPGKPTTMKKSKL
jgi:hypothetical protein